MYKELTLPGLDALPVPRPEFHAKTMFLIGCSGGKDSTAVILWFIHESGLFEKYKSEVNFCDINNDHPWTLGHIEKISRELHPVVTLKPELDFFELALKKHRFPSTKARFCTEHLKIHPTQDRVLELKRDGWDIISISGVRADESDEREFLPEWDYSGTLLCRQWRPLITWKLEDVFAIHKKYNFPLNPLYALGAKRVGCWPCIMSRKAEIRTIALNFPERIDEIRKVEQEFEARYGRYSSFFPRTSIPERFRTKPLVDNGVQIMEDILQIVARNEGGEPIYKKIGEKPMMIATIDDVVAWSMTGDRAKGSYLDHEEKEPINCKSGFCE